MSENVITRFPPSPTGFFHIGSARTALFNYLFAKHHGGTMYLRFEDTDKERSRPEFEADILEGLRWFGITYSMPDIPRQSERTAVYTDHFKKLLAAGKAYEAEESKSGTGRVVRFKNPNTRVSFTDLVRGEVSFDTAELGDFVIAKNISEPLYHLAVVIDDAEMGVTHVIRGEDHISNTPRQILIQEALGLPRPVYAHIPLILAPDRSKLSKRHGARSVSEYRADGYLPEAVVNFIALLGWHPDDEREVFSLEELVKEFDLSRVQKGGAVFDTTKLDWLNKRYLERISDDDFLAGVAPFLPQAVSAEMRARLVPTLRERVSVFGEVQTLTDNGELDYLAVAPTIEKEKLAWKDSTLADALRHLAEARARLNTLSESDFSAERVKAALWDYAEQEGKGAVLWPLRYALTSQEKSPDPFTVAHILGKAETLRRIETVLTNISPHIH